MKEVLVGQIVNTHGLKGELRIISNFAYKDLVFKNGFKVYVGSRKELCTINSYRHHKIYDMVTFDGVDSIDTAITYKGDYVYINREDLKVDGYILEDLIDMDVYSEDRFIGRVNEIINNNADKRVVDNITELGLDTCLLILQDYFEFYQKQMNEVVFR